MTRPKSAIVLLAGHVDQSVGGWRIRAAADGRSEGIGLRGRAVVVGLSCLRRRCGLGILGRKAVVLRRDVARRLRGRRGVLEIRRLGGVVTFLGGETGALRGCRSGGCFRGTFGLELSQAPCPGVGEGFLLEAETLLLLAMRFRRLSSLVAEEGAGLEVSHSVRFGLRGKGAGGDEGGDECCDLEHGFLHGLAMTSQCTRVVAGAVSAGTGDAGERLRGPPSRDVDRQAANVSEGEAYSQGTSMTASAAAEYLRQLVGF